MTRPALRLWGGAIFGGGIGLIVAAIAFAQMLLLLPNSSAHRVQTASYQFGRLNEFVRCIAPKLKVEENEVPPCGCRILGICDKEDQTSKTLFERASVAVMRLGGGHEVVYGVFTGIFITLWLSLGTAIAAPFDRRLVAGRELQSWCVEAGPLLGVTGTLVGMTTFFASGDSTPDSFLSHFSTAAASTMLGACVAVVNQVAWVWASWWR